MLNAYRLLSIDIVTMTFLKFIYHNNNTHWYFTCLINNHYHISKKLTLCVSCLYFCPIHYCVDFFLIFLYLFFYFLRKFGNIIDNLIMQEANSPEQSMYARLVVRREALDMVDHFLDYNPRMKFSINGKSVWVRKYIRKLPLAQLLQPAAPSRNFPWSCFLIIWFCCFNDWDVIVWFCHQSWSIFNKVYAFEHLFVSRLMNFHVIKID